MKIIYKNCSLCKERKHIKFFSSDNRRNNKGYKSWCKQCCAKHIKDNRTAHIKRNRTIRKRYRRQWLSYFHKIYGKNIQCSICHKKLSWNGKDLKSTPNFDHRHGGHEEIKGCPAGFYNTRALTAKNKEIWTKCDFGILCFVCNALLPTQNRTDWLNNVVKYVQKTNSTN